ncbi:MAG: hypothetical protein K8R90_02215 [Candidatus Cloacimonetes bacterium]|nr:hypothetical protein [Candidatus Cloacimonadota bacterium]
MQTIIFDDAGWFRFFPLTMTRSTGDLRCGALKLRQKIQAALGIEQTAVLVHQPLQALYRERHPDWSVNLLPAGDALLVNSRLRLSEPLIATIEALSPGVALLHEQNILAARLTTESAELDAGELIPLLDGLGCIEWDGEQPLWERLWDLVLANGEQIAADFADFFYDSESQFDTELGVTVLNPENIWVGEGVVLKPGVVIDAGEGPVIIDEGAHVGANAVIEGPVFIGKGSTIKPGAKILCNTSIGPVCKVGGEVEDTIFQAYSNKQHDGFLGHAYVGEWVNLGADTNNSDLKNNYKPVKVHCYDTGGKVDSGSLFVGAALGDHVKVGINCSLNTGVVVGVGSNLYGPRLIRDFIPGFRWGEAGELVSYRLDKFLETAATVKARRKLTLSAVEKELYRQIAELESDG